MNERKTDANQDADLKWDQPLWEVSGEWPEEPAIDDEAFARAIAEGRRQQAA